MDARPSQSAPGMVASINVTPMIDVMLVLLVIFMLLVHTRMIFQVTVPPPLPPHQEAEPAIVLELPEQGGYAINGTAVDHGVLESRLRAIYRDRPAKLLFVRVATRRRYHEVIEAIDVARGAGVEVIAYAP